MYKYYWASNHITMATHYFAGTPKHTPLVIVWANSLLVVMLTIIHSTWQKGSKISLFHCWYCRKCKLKNWGGSEGVGGGKEKGSAYSSLRT